MSKRIQIFCCLLILGAFFAVAFGCGEYREGIIQKAEKSFLWFTGETENAVVFVDGKEFARLSAATYVDDQGQKKQKKDVTYYQLEPGRHEIRIEKGGNVVVNRTVLLGNQMTKEIMVP